MKFNEIVTRGFLVVVLVALAVASRLAVIYCPWVPPNFHCVAATALFAGFLFRGRAIALLVPFAAMWISDQVLGGYDRTVMLAVYGSLALPVLFGKWLERRLSASRVVGAALVSSVLFFLVTNLAVWATSTWYPHTVDGISRCFLRALPFFAYTLAGDLTYAGGLFGLYWLATASARQRGSVSNAAASSAIACRPLPAQS